MDNITLNGFEVFEELMPGASVKNKINTTSTTEEEDTKIDIDSVSEELSEEELNDIRKTTKTEDKEVENIEEDIVEEDKVKTKTTPNKEDKNKEVELEEEEGEDEPSNETTMVTGFFDSLSEKLGWEDVSEEEKPKTVEDLIDYFNDVIEENSTP